jgi:colanic acid/amylovoran biosynthesis glycosyltransferase
MPKSRIKRFFEGLFIFLLHFHKKPLVFFNIFNFFRHGKRSFSFELMYLVLPFLNNDRYDIIQSHFGRNGTLSIWLRHLGVLKGKIVTSFHGYDCNAHSVVRSKDIYKELFLQGDLFFVNSKFTMDKIVLLGCPQDKIVHLPVGIPFDKFQRKDYSSTTRDTGIKILTIARCVEKKGLEYSMKAIAQIVMKYPNIKYKIVGDGPLRTALQSLAEHLDISRNVKFLGWCDQNEVLRLYRDSHIFLLASVTAGDGDREGQALVLQEAQAIGLPVVSTFHNGIPEGVLDGESGFLVPERDVNALADRLLYLIEHPEVWPQMGRAGRRFVEEKYDLNKLNAQLVRTYEELLSR